MKRISVILLSLLLLASLLTACGSPTGLQDGYYTAQAAEFNFGWKEYITILVKGGRIISVEYNAENASGFIKSWDNAYMQTMLHSNGTYPSIPATTQTSFWRARAQTALTQSPGRPPLGGPFRSWPRRCWSRPGRGIPASCMWTQRTRRLTGRARTEPVWSTNTRTN